MDDPLENDKDTRPQGKICNSEEGKSLQGINNFRHHFGISVFLDSIGQY